MAVSRRWFLSGLLAAPLVVPAENLMKLKGTPFVPIRHTWTEIELIIPLHWEDLRTGALVADNCDHLRDFRRVQPTFRSVDREWTEYRMAGEREYRITNPEFAPSGWLTDWKVDYTKWCKANNIQWGHGETVVNMGSPKPLHMEDTPKGMKLPEYVGLPPRQDFLEEKSFSGPYAQPRRLMS